ncbi:MAG: putative hemolysin [Alteromonas naphthalenivorans]|jgi:putative hemolysin
MEAPLTSGIMYLQISYFTVSLLFCALFSFLETAVTALRLFNLKEIAKGTKGYRLLFTTLEQEPQRVLISILIANSIANVTSAALITQVMEDLFARLQLSEGLGFSLGIAIATTAILIIGEILPKNIAQAYGSSLFKSTLWLINITFYLMYPLVIILSMLSNSIIGAMRKNDGSKDGAENMLSSEKEIQFLIEYINKKGLMDSDKSQMLNSIFDLGNTKVEEIMVPEVDVLTLNVETTIDEALKVFAKYHFSRLPVYEGRADNIIGMVHQKDIFLLLSLSQEEEKPLKALVRPILFVPESMRVNQLLRQFKQQRHHIAMVLNEYGGIIGLVTLEDAIEEIVGDINDEHESVAEHIVPLENGGWLIYAGVDLYEISKLLNIRFNNEDAITLAGFLTEKLQHLPRKGERFAYEGYVFQIQKSTPKRVVQVLVFKDK